MAKRLNDAINVTAAVNPISSSTAVTGIAVDASSYGRARFVFNFGAQTGTASLVANAGVWQASASGGTFAQIAGTSMSAVTSANLGGTVHVIDVPVTPTTPWLKVSGLSIMNSDIIVGAICELYSGVNLPPTSTAYQVAVV